MTSYTEHLNPAKTVIKRLGGVDAVMKITGKSRTRVFRWMYSRERGGTGGLIPQRAIPALLNYAKRKQISLRPGDFFTGAVE